MSLRVLAIFMFWASYAGYSRTATFSIFSRDHAQIGNLKVTSIETDTTTKIFVAGQFNVKLLIAVAVKYTLATVFRNNELYSGEVLTYRNNNLHSAANTTKTGGQYMFTKDGEVSAYDKIITFSESLLYFNEPVNRQNLYSEFDGVEKLIFNPNPGH